MVTTAVIEMGVPIPPTDTFTPTPTPSPTETPSPTNTPTPSETPTLTPTPSVTPPLTPDPPGLNNGIFLPFIARPVPSFEEQCLASDIEPNDTSSLAFDLGATCFNREISGSLENLISDKDLYYIEWPTAGPIEIQMERLATDANFVLTLYHESDEANEPEAHDGGKAKIKILQKDNLAAGNYYLFIVRDTGSGPYSFSIFTR